MEEESTRERSLADAGMSPWMIALSNKWAEEASAQAATTESSLRELLGNGGSSRGSSPPRGSSGSSTLRRVDTSVSSLHDSFSLQGSSIAGDLDAGKNDEDEELRAFDSWLNSESASSEDTAVTRVMRSQSVQLPRPPQPSPPKTRTWRFFRNHSSLSDRDAAVVRSREAALKKCAQKLRSQIAQRVKQMKRLSGHVGKIEAAQTRDVDQWRRFAQRDLEHLARSYYEQEILKTRLMLQAEELMLTQLQTVEAELKTVLSARTQERRKRVLRLSPEQSPCLFEVAVLCLEPQLELREPADFRKPSEIVNLRNQMSILKQVVKKIKEDYRLKKEQAARNEEPKARSARVLTAVERCYMLREKHRETHWHDVANDGGAQRDFDALMSDQRHREGAKLRDWKRMLSKLLRSNSSDEAKKAATLAFSKFLTEFSSGIVTRFELPEHLVPAVHLCVRRLVFPSTLQLWPQLASSGEIKKDRTFERKVMWMRTLSQKQLGIEAEHVHRPGRQYDVDQSALEEVLQSVGASQQLGGNGTVRWCGASVSEAFPYAAAIAVLGLVKTQSVPCDVLRTIVAATKACVELAKIYAQQPSQEIGADFLFPILVWVVCHADVPQWNALLGHLERFLPHTQHSFGEGAFVLSLVHAATEFVERAKPEDYDLPADIEVDATSPVVISPTSSSASARTTVTPSESLAGSSSSSGGSAGGPVKRLRARRARSKTISV